MSDIIKGVVTTLACGFGGVGGALAGSSVGVATVPGAIGGCLFGMSLVSDFGCGGNNYPDPAPKQPSCSSGGTLAISDCSGTDTHGPVSMPSSPSTEPPTPAPTPSEPAPTLTPGTSGSSARSSSIRSVDYKGVHQQYLMTIQGADFYALDNNGDGIVDEVASAIDFDPAHPVTLPHDKTLLSIAQGEVDNFRMDLHQHVQALWNTSSPLAGRNIWRLEKWIPCTDGTVNGSVFTPTIATVRGGFSDADVSDVMLADYNRDGKVDTMSFNMYSSLPVLITADLRLPDIVTTAEPMKGCLLFIDLNRTGVEMYLQDFDPLFIGDAVH